MRRAVALLVILSLAPLADARRRAVSAPPLFTVPQLDAIGAAAVADGIPGLTIGVQKGSSYAIKAFGNMRADSVYQTASITKQFTAAAIMRLAELGKLRIEDKLRTWMPELDARFDAITLEHLLTHTSGLREYTSQLGDPFTPRSQQEVVAVITSSGPRFAPGSRFEYSNSGYYVLGIVIERASSQAYAQFLRDAFFEPLRLRGTSYCDPAPDGYVFGADGKIHEAPAVDMSRPYAAGALCSTADDLVRWTFALASGAVVSPQSYARMTTGVNPTDVPPPGYGYGLILSALDGRRRIWHNGLIFGFQSHAARYPDEQLTVVVLINALDPARDRATQIGNAVARAMR